MNTLTAKHDIVRQLQKEIISLQGFARTGTSEVPVTGLEFLSGAFPENTFPTAAVHGLVSSNPGSAAATSGFLFGLLRAFAGKSGTCIWVSSKRFVFPPALKAFGIDPERIIFIDARREKEALWTIEEALKCKAITAVVGELKDVGLTASRRLQHAVEESRVTGFIHRYGGGWENPDAFVTRWKISPLPGALPDDLPGVGFPRWNVELQRIRNGRPGAWPVEWTPAGFRSVPRFAAAVSRKIKTG